MENTFRPSRFLSLRATTPSPCTWEEIMQELTGERHAAATALFRALAAGEGQDAETSKRQQSQIKQNQPAFVPSVHLEGGRSSKHIKGYPGSIMVDIDGIPEEIFDETLERVRADPHSFLAYKTLSGRGIRVIAWMEGEVTEENFPAAWQTVNAYYARLTGIAIDRQCKNATRMSVICHDPNALYRPDAERMKFASLPGAKAGQKQDIAAGKKHRGRKTSAARAENTVRRLVEEEGIHYAAGSHNDYISRCLYLMNRFGVPEAEAEAWAVELFADYDTASVRSTAKSCYALTAEHATMKLSDVSPRNGNGRQRKATVEEMERFIGGSMQLRMNQLTHQLEHRPVTEGIPAPDGWAPMTDTVENSLWCSMRRDGRVHPGRPLSLEGAHCFGHNRHSIGICYEGGLDGKGLPADTRTPAQKAALTQLLQELGRHFPAALTVGHRDLNPQKACPSFDAAKEYKKDAPRGRP